MRSRSSAGVGQGGFVWIIRWQLEQSSARSLTDRAFSPPTCNGWHDVVAFDIALSTLAVLLGEVEHAVTFRRRANRGPSAHC